MRFVWLSIHPIAVFGITVLLSFLTSSLNLPANVVEQHPTQVSQSFHLTSWVARCRTRCYVETLVERRTPRAFSFLASGVRSYHISPHPVVVRTKGWSYSSFTVPHLSLTLNWSYARLAPSAFVIRGDMIYLLRGWAVCFSYSLGVRVGPARSIAKTTAQILCGIESRKISKALRARIHTQSQRR